MKRNELLDSFTNEQVLDAGDLMTAILALMDRAHTEAGLSTDQITFALAHTLNAAMDRGDVDSLEEVAPVDGSVITATFTRN